MRRRLLRSESSEPLALPRHPGGSHGSVLLRGGGHPPAVAAVEVVGVVRVVLEDEGLLLDDGVALLTDVLPQAASLLSVVTRTTQVSGYTQERLKISRLNSAYIYI